VASGTGRASSTHTLFRRANEDLLARRAALLEALGDMTELVPILCECADTRCTRVLQVKLEEFEEIRLQHGRYVMLPGHERSGNECVVERDSRFVVVEELARQPRMPP
jgi:hypothetical protein